MKERKSIPTVESKLRDNAVKVPECIYTCSGINILEKRIKSILFSTDVAIIHNHNAHAIMAVYPFTPQISITQAILTAATVPVLVGVGGGRTGGKRSVAIAFQAELLGALGVVVNGPMPADVIKEISDAIDIPVIATIPTLTTNYKEKLDAGASILNVACGKDTAAAVRKIRHELGEDVPIIATGGPSDEYILETIQAGANCITYTPMSSAELLEAVMKKYRGQM